MLLCSPPCRLKCRTIPSFVVFLLAHVHLKVGSDVGDGPLVLVSIVTLEAVALRERRRVLGPARAVRVRLRGGLLVVDPVEDGGEDLPRNVQLVVTDKVGGITLERVQDEGLVRLGNLDVGEAVLVRHVELDGDGLGDKAGELVVELEVDGLVGLDAEDEFVARNVGEDTRGDVLELHTDLDLGLVES